MRVVHWSSVLAAIVVAAACGGPIKSPGNSAGPKPLAAQNAGASAAEELFSSLCFTCHGSSGHGDGPGAGVLQPKPRSFADVAWQDSVTDEHIKKAIVFGGAAVGKSPMMPAQPQLKGQEATLEGLVRIVRGFKGNTRQ